MNKTHEQKIRKVVEDFLHDEFNLEDRSVGIEFVYELDEDLVKWINEEVEEFTVVEWDKYSMTIECEGVYVKVVKKTFDDEDRWVIVE